MSSHEGGATKQTNGKLLTTRASTRSKHIVHRRGRRRQNVCAQCWHRWYTASFGAGCPQMISPTPSETMRLLAPCSLRSTTLTPPLVTDTPIYNHRTTSHPQHLFIRPPTFSNLRTRISSILCVLPRCLSPICVVTRNQLCLICLRWCISLPSSLVSLTKNSDWYSSNGCLLIRQGIHTGRSILYK